MASLVPGAVPVVGWGLARVRGWLADLERLALGQRCPGCALPIEPAEPLCEGCLRSLARLEVPLCVRCLAAEREAAGCTRHPSHRAFAAWVYDERIAPAIHALKYEGRRILAPGLGVAIAESLPPAYRPDLVVAVPLHRVRLRERGYNQAASLARSVAGRLGCPVFEGALERHRNTRPQARLGSAPRRANLRGAFRVTEPAALEGRTILVVDDVITTGSTLEACLDALESCGARGAGAAVAWAS